MGHRFAPCTAGGSFFPIIVFFGKTRMEAIRVARRETGMSTLPTLLPELFSRRCTLEFRNSEQSREQHQLAFCKEIRHPCEGTNAAIDRSCADHGYFLNQAPGRLTDACSRTLPMSGEGCRKGTSNSRAVRITGSRCYYRDRHRECRCRARQSARRRRRRRVTCRVPHRRSGRRCRHRRRR